MSKLEINKEYKNWLIEIKSRIKNSQIKASIKVNTELIALYWEIGAMIVERQENAKWGSAFIKQMAIDLNSDFPDLTGFSQRNLYSMRQFYLFYSQGDEILHQLGAKLEKGSNEILHQVGAKLETPYKTNVLTKIPWRHHTLILQKIKNTNEAIFYIKETIDNNWSRSVLEFQIESNLYKRQGKAISNFKNTLPEADSDLAQHLLKDPYNFGFLTLTKQAKEKDLETKLIKQISDFLLELGKGFAYMGRQYKLQVGKREFFTDLLFYHTKLKAYIVIELKMKEFEPEFIGKLNFYTTAINETIKDENDKSTIGILLCKTKDDFVVDFSIKDINKPIGVSEFTYTELPSEIKEQLPSKKDFEQIIRKSYDTEE
ncbi:MAG: PDDEXK nuclease domain-containing protein [Bacteroidota bacterium]|nr:PDDEXK nuclease domain-containing protein [Bacteroidota bacterium]